MGQFENPFEVPEKNMLGVYTSKPYTYCETCLLIVKHRI